MKKIIILLIVLLGVSEAISQEMIGEWEGEFRVSTTALSMRAKFSKSGDSLIGTLDIPQQQAFGLKLTNVIQHNDLINFDLIVSADNTARFNGTISADSMGGKFTQMAFEGTFTMTRAKRLVNPEDLTYTEEEVTFNNGDVTLAGTLTIPKSGSKFPAVVLITGSGPQNRDEEVFGFKVFATMADYLSSRGIAVLRYDDRGVGGSTGDLENATTEDFSNDALAGFNFLKTRPKIDPKKIGLLGHSEGAIAAAMVAAKEKSVAFVFYMAGSAISGKEIILSQVEEMMATVEIDENDKKEAIKLQDKILTAIIQNKDMEPFKEEILKFRIKLMTPKGQEAKEPDQKYIDQMKQAIDRELYTMMSPWYVFFLSYNPVTALEKIKCPFIAVFGELDRQVSTKLNRAPLEKALAKAKNKDFAVKVIPKTNHLFQKAVTGQVDEYEKLDKEFAFEFIELVHQWIKDKTK